LKTPGRRFASIAYTAAASDPRVRRHCESLARHGYRVIQIGLGDSSDPSVGRLGDVVLVRYRHHRYRGRQLWRYAAAYLRFLVFAWFVVRRLTRRRGVDVVQVTNLPDSLVICANPARHAGAGLILDLRDPMPELYESKFGSGWWTRIAVRLLRAQERWASRRSDLVLTVNEPHRRATVIHGVAADRLRVILNAADENLIPRLTPPERLEPRLVYHGTVAQRMGLDVVIEAVRRLNDVGVPLTCDLYGDGDAVPALRRQIEQLALEHVVSISGRRHPMSELVPLIRAASIAIVPMSRDVFMDLVLPSKLIEYVRLGLPVVVTRTPTMTAYFDETMVWYLSTLTSSELVSSVQHILAHPEQRAQQTLAAQSWQSFEGTYLGLVGQLVAEQGRRTALHERRKHASAVLGSPGATRIARSGAHGDLPANRS
jgi:glycosyltransferase involved in cell wall biosynthesis